MDYKSTFSDISHRTNTNGYSPLLHFPKAVMILTLRFIASALIFVQQRWTPWMKDHQFCSLLLNFCGVNSDSFSGQMRLYWKTLKKVKVKNYKISHIWKGSTSNNFTSFLQMIIQFWHLTPSFLTYVKHFNLLLPIPKIAEGINPNVIRFHRSKVVS